jgi:hypothetical protein
VTKKSKPRHPLAAVPPQRGISRRPPQKVKQAPAERGIGKLPNPRKPKLVRDVHGNELRDLFQFFPDLPRPPRRPARVPPRKRRRS